MEYFCLFAFDIIENVKIVFYRYGRMNARLIDMLVWTVFDCLSSSNEYVNFIQSTYRTKDQFIKISINFLFPSICINLLQMHYINHIIPCNIPYDIWIYNIFLLGVVLYTHKLFKGTAEYKNTLNEFQMYISYLQSKYTKRLLVRLFVRLLEYIMRLAKLQQTV